MKNFLTLLMAVAVLGMLPAPSQAACSMTGTMIRVKMKDDNAKGSHVLYMRVSKDDTFFYTAKTTDDELAQTAATLAALQTRIQVKGSKSCPNNGNNRGLGKVVELVAVP